MITGIFHPGSGLGDQLFRYITVRTLAEEKGYEWYMENPYQFKGADFMRIEISSGPSDWFKTQQNLSFWNEKETVESGVDIRSYDPEINFVEDNTVIDGSFEDSKYWGHNLDNISKWLAVEPLEVPDDFCVIGFRGGEYYSDPNLGLPKEYFDEAIAKMREINPAMRFQVHTDDTLLAKRLFPDFEVIENTPISHSKHSNMGFNWRSARYAKYAIIPNSAFFILPRLLAHANLFDLVPTEQMPGSTYVPSAVTIAPRYWARRNTKTWARPACYYKPFLYI